MMIGFDEIGLMCKQYLKQRRIKIYWFACVTIWKNPNGGIRFNAKIRASIKIICFLMLD
jgi:hypothetical protein